jgi:hypothetical protein
MSRTVPERSEAGRMTGFVASNEVFGRTAA